MFVSFEVECEEEKKKKKRKLKKNKIKNETVPTMSLPTIRVPAMLVLTTGMSGSSFSRTLKCSEPPYAQTQYELVSLAKTPISLLFSKAAPERREKCALSKKRTQRDKRKKESKKSAAY
jgi:hypothetical protein